jgi:uncharacterized protein YlxW (UPF0749 family)
MDNDKFQELVLQQFQVMNKRFETTTGELQALKEGQARMETRMNRLEKSQDILATEVIDLYFEKNQVSDEEFVKLLD